MTTMTQPAQTRQTREIMLTKLSEDRLTRLENTDDISVLVRPDIVQVSIHCLNDTKELIDRYTGHMAVMSNPGEGLGLIGRISDTSRSLLIIRTHRELFEVKNGVLVARSPLNYNEGDYEVMTMKHKLYIHMNGGVEHLKL